MNNNQNASPLLRTARDSVTEIWNDSCSTTELAYAIEHGAVGATSNPLIVSQVLKAEWDVWQPRIAALVEEHPTADEVAIAWMIIETISVTASKLLLPVFARSGGANGRLSLQTNPLNYRNTAAMVEQALHFHALAANIQVKVPATAAGIAAIEELTYRGVATNATVSFSVAQALAVAEAVERGAARARAEGRKRPAGVVCTLMVGRVDDWLKVVADKHDVIVDPDCLEWAGVAVMKRAYQLYQERGYATRLLAAAYRNHLHWSQFVGGAVSLTIPYQWQRRFNAADVAVEPRMNQPVEPRIVNSLLNHFEDFRKAYEPDGMVAPEFEHYGAAARTLRSFISGYYDLIGMVRDVMVPNPDRG